MFEHLDFLPGKIIFNGYDISSDEPIDEDNDSLAEDMFQVVYPDNYVIDVGWYVGVNKFRIYVIKDFNWEKPALLIECDDLNTLNAKMKECVEFVKESCRITR